jgi:hypothetical protein
VGFGLNDSPYMVGSDTYTGWVTSGGVVNVVDGYATAQIQPIADTSDDVLSYSGYQVIGTTTIIDYFPDWNKNNFFVCKISGYWRFFER